MSENQAFKMPSSSILSDFEWDEGLTMPVANAENKLMEEEVSIFVSLFSVVIYCRGCHVNSSDLYTLTDR